MSRRSRFLELLLFLSIFGWLVLLIWWWVRLRQQRGLVPSSETVVAKPPPVTIRVREMVQVVPDDLKRIEGIGPKISSVLNAAGIVTFAQLAETDVKHLKRILRDGKIRIAFPATWPEQASLAAAGEWAVLEALQDELKGGRREAGQR